jgi:RNA polymerase sigma-70 factor (ECF subfamily)
MQTNLLPMEAGASHGEKELVDRIRQGDEGAVRTMVQRHNRRLFRIARAIVKNDAEAEDIVQETYVRAFTSLGSFRGESALLTWLTRIALNEALGRLRRSRPALPLDELSSAGDVDGARLIMFPTAQLPKSPEAELARSQVRHLLEHAVDDLPEPFRVVLILRDIEEMSIEETAALLMIKPETVKTRLHRARKLIRTALSKRLPEAFSELFPFDGRRCVNMADRVIDRMRSRDNLPD